MLRRRRLLPRDTSDGGPELPPLPPQQTAKKYFTHACDACHKRKIKCDRQRPQCSGCRHQGIACKLLRRQTIVTTVGEGKSQQITKLFDSLPEHEAAELLQGLVARSKAASGLSKQIPEHDLIRNTLPPTQNSIEFELTIQHPIAYPQILPIQLTALPLESLLEPNNTFLSRSLSRSLDSLYGTSDNRNQFHDTVVWPTSFARELNHKPLFRKRLRNVDIGIWTEVPILNDLAIRIISFYFEVDYVVFPLFNADLFIDNLALGRHWFCSKLLVNSLLCCACQTFTPLGPNMPSLCVAFFNEANRLLDQETELNTLTSVAALQLLCLSCCMLGFWNDATRYLRRSVQIGTRMGLFGVQSTSESANEWLADHEDWSRAASYTAWGVFNWVVKFGLHFRTSEIDTAPTLPRPGAIKISQADPAEIISEVTQHAEYFNAACDFWVIMSDVNKKYWGISDQRMPNGDTLGAAEAVYRQLLSWAANLPLSLTRGEQTSHNIMLLHMYLHCMVTDLFRPFLASPWRATPLRRFANQHVTPEAVHAASVNQLKRLLLIYCLRCKLGLFSLFYHTAILYFVNALINEASTATRSDNIAIKGTELSHYMDLCIAGGRANAGSYRGFCSVASGLSAMALQHGITNVRKAAGVAREIQQLIRHHDPVAESSKRAPGVWILDQAISKINPGAVTVDKLAERLQKLMVSDETDNRVREGWTDILKRRDNIAELHLARMRHEPSGI